MLKNGWTSETTARALAGGTAAVGVGMAAAGRGSAKGGQKTKGTESARNWAYAASTSGLPVVVSRKNSMQLQAIMERGTGAGERRMSVGGGLVANATGPEQRVWAEQWAEWKQMSLVQREREGVDSVARANGADHHSGPPGIEQDGAMQETAKGAADCKLPGTRRPCICHTPSYSVFHLSYEKCSLQV